MPRFSCYVISLLWNPYAQIRFGSGLWSEKVVSTPSLTKVKTLFPGCVEARISATVHLYGEVQKTSRPRLLLSFPEAKHAIAARLVLQEQRTKGNGWAGVEYARRVVNLFDGEKRADELLSFQVPHAGQQGLDWITAKLGVPWYFAMEEPEFKTFPSTKGVTKVLAHSYAYGSNGKARILSRLMVPQPRRSPRRPSILAATSVVILGTVPLHAGATLFSSS